MPPKPKRPTCRHCGATFTSGQPDCCCYRHTKPYLDCGHRKAKCHICGKPTAPQSKRCPEHRDARKTFLATNPKPNPVGRPRTARGRGTPQVVIRLSPAEATTLDEWRGLQSRAEYLRLHGFKPR